MSRGVRVLGALALTLCAGCASSPGPAAVEPTVGGTGFGAASPPTAAIPDCRNSGVYNRAANLCVSAGP